MRILLRHALRVMGGAVHRRWFVTTVVVLAACSFALAAAPAALALETGLDFGTATGLSTQDIRVTVAKIIRVAFGLLGVVAIGIVLTGGVMWMTSGGDEEKLTKAKKILTNGVIGLTIMLLSFAITQFVLSRLQQALGSGGVQIATEGGAGTLPPGATTGGCADPGGTVPFVCSVSPLSGGVGSYVTVRGYRFGSFTSGTSKVQIGTAEAPIVACQGTPNWGENLIVAEVPQLDTGRSYPVTVTSPGGTSSNPRSLNVTADPLGPQIACIIPGSGAEGAGVSITGKLFGTTAGTVRFGGNVTATTSAWEDAGITSVVPVGAQSGEVTVTQGDRTSNGYLFTVTCTTGSQCSVSNCCAQGQCVEAAACAPGGPPSTVGASCDGDAIAPACQPIACGGGLRCDLGSCTCQEGPTVTAVSPQTLVSTADGTAYRRVEDVPTGTQTVTAPNGAPGNYVTIRGRGFGDALCSNDATKRCSRNADCGDSGTCQGLGRVVFMGADGAADDQVATLASCASAWSDTEVIAVVPAGAAVGPIRIESQDPAFFDQTDDARGTAIEHFRLNTTVRPGLCAITPPSATIGASVALAGAQFGASKGADDATLFGDQTATTSAWAATAISATVPAIAEGPIDVRIRNDGELSNDVTFIRAPEPIEPRIQDIIPSSGGGGQYVTIRGQNFGAAIGKVTFTRGAETIEVRPKFPDQCSTNWWKGNEITLRIPATRPEWGPPVPPEGSNALGAYEVRVHARDGNAFRASNTAMFTVTTDQPTPGICAITPASGPANTSVQFIGERFGGVPGTVRFFDGVVAVIAAGSWADGLVRDVLVPATARTGVVRLWQAGQLPDRDDDAAAPGLQGNRGSNPVTFEVKDCRAGGAAACAAGQVCCGDGTCAARAGDCVTGPNQGSYQWTFATGVVPKMPRVVESCDAFSPSPWDSQGQGGSACVNANVRVQFSTSMAKADGGALDATTAGLGIQVFRCGAGTNVAAAAGGTFEAENALTNWRVVEGALDAPPDATPLESAHLRASRSDALPAGQAHGGNRVLLLDKLQPSATDNVPPNTEPRTIDLPRDAPVDRHYFAVQAPSTLITDTNGTTYTARVFVRDPTPAQNPNRRAGIVVGRNGGDTPTDPGWFQQVANEVAIDGTWKELAASITFDSGPNAKQVVDGIERATPGFVRLYVTGPPADQPASADDAYAVQFDDLEVIRTGDACAVREEVAGLPDPTVSSEQGRLQLTDNILTVQSPLTNWAPGTWYEVVLLGDDAPANAGNAFRNAGTPQLRLDGDKDGQEGGNYRFRFRTRDSAEPCAVQSVLTTPQDGLATQPCPGRLADGTCPAANTALAGRTSADDPGLVHLRADGIGDPTACFLLNTAGMPWSWAPQQPDAAGPYASVDATGGRWCVAESDCAIITCRTNADCASWDSTAPTCSGSGRCTGTSFCTDTKRCTLSVNDGPNYFANTATARALKETPVNAVGVSQPVEVRATVAPTGGQSRTGESDVTVRFEKPRVTTVYPTASCQQACPNSRIIAVTNVDIVQDSLTASNVRLYECQQENCRRGESTSVDAVSATACASGTGTAGDCSRRIGTEPQIVFALPAAYNGNTGQLKANQSYRLILAGGATGIRSAWDVPLDQLNYADNDTGAVDAYSWMFRTRTEPCGVSRVELSPNPLVFQAVGQRAAISAVPFSAPDQCSPAGQSLDAETLPWAWDVVNAGGVVADFTTVSAAGGAFTPPGSDQFTQTTRVAGPTCTLSCLSPGSRRVPGICGNGVLEVAAEECERQADGTFLSWCDVQTCLRKGASPTPNGTCGDGDVDAGEECDGGRRCAAGGPKAGEACAQDTDCSVTIAGVTASSACTFVFPVWCDPGSCLRKGSGFGSACGNGSPATQENPNAPVQAAGDGEDCDDGNTRDGDGCSSRCLLEGTPRRYHATNAPNGILARCGDGSIADGMRDGGGGFDCDGTDARPCERNHEPNGGEECDPGAVSREAWAAQRCDYDRCVRLGARPITEAGGSCGNGLLNPDVGEQCDDGAVGSCSAASGVHAGNPCATAADCGAGGACEDRQPVGGDGCSADCLFEGSSIAWRNAVTGAPRPSLCGDGIAFDGQGGRPFGGEACDAESAAGEPDPVQIIQALGRAPANAAGVQETTATANAGAPAPGQGIVRLVCGHQSDAECDFPDANPAVTPADHGIDRAGCCQLRPEILVQSPVPNATGVCRNAQVTVRFNQLIDPASVGVATDLATGASVRRGAILERQDGAAWQEVAATPMLTVVLADSATVSELRFTLTQAMAAGTMYRVKVLGAGDDTASSQRSIRSIDGVRFGATDVWTFTTGLQVCLMSRVDVQPPSYLLQRRESRAPLEVTALALTPSGEQLIGEVGGYGWQYAWSSTAEDIATRVATPLPGGEDPQYPCGDSQRCAFKPAEPAKNGNAFGKATVTITENIFAPICTPETATQICGQGRTCTDGHCVGETFTDATQLRALICENPWPAVTNPATWAPHELPGEGVSLAYCRDQGDGKVCRNQLDKPCSQNSDCPTGSDAICILDSSDDLPVFENPASPAVPSATLGNERDELRKEFFFLPRGAHYCSVSGERCDPTLAGICPLSEFCRQGNDAIGIRIYENEQHVAAQRWFERQGFTEATTPIEVDQYRGVRAGRSTYLNIANIGSIFTNLFVLSFNDGAVEETKEILKQVLDGIRFNTDIAEQNLRTCGSVGRCSQGGALCRATTDCTGTGNTCDLEQPVACTADRDCRVGATAGTCAAPKDKLARDVRRLEDLNEIRLAIEAYGQGQRRCSVTPKTCEPAAAVGSEAGCPANETCLLPSPDLSAGTFVPGFTTSRWPSWAAELGKVLGAALPMDPLNVFGGPCVADAEQNADYDQGTCWNQEAGTYTPPAGSYLYEYQRAPTGTWTIRTGFEHVNPNDLRPPDLQPIVDGEQRLLANMSATTGGVPSQAYSATGRCGDGALAPGEECDPPGTTGVQDGEVTSCDANPTLGGVQPGFQFRTCQQDCRWSGMSACGSQCGNFVWDSDTGEQCDVGSAGGRVPAGHPISGVVPGISTTEYWNTATAAWTPVIAQYACSATCMWTGGLCGDSIVQAGYGESCDLSANRAATPAESSAATQYGCAPSYAPNPCKGIGGFCGDGTIQDGMTMAGDVFTCDGSSSPCAPGHAPKPSAATGYEQCDGDQVRSCIFSAKCGGDGPLCATDSDCTAQPTGKRACVAQLALPVAGATSVAYQSNTAIIFPFFLRSAGSIRVAVETSNDDVDLSNFTRDQIEAHLPSGQTINDFNPQGAQGGIGLYHRMRVRVCDETGAGCVEAAQPMWALAAATSQVSTGVVSGISDSGNRRLVIEWDNDWFGGTAATDSNLRIYRVTVSGAQTRSCGTPETSAACKVLSSTTGGIANSSAQGVDVFPIGWSACQAAGAQCGNGTIDSGEECDDGGKGRCANELTKVCASSAECTGGAACERDLDLCTSECKRNVCGDARQLAATCTAGHASKIGQPCTSNAQCGANGLCATEQCDLGTSNWRQGSQCTDQSPFACTACDPAGGLGQLCVGDPCTPGGTQCGGPAGVCGDPRCVDSTACDYGRTCNYCTIGSCSIATKQGGLCGDRVKNGPEACDVVDGTNQCEGLSGTARTQCEQAVSAALMPGGTCTSLSGTSLTQCQTAWSRQICNAACDAMCPPASTNANLRFTSGNPNAAKFNATDTKNLTVDACRLLDAFKYDVELGPGVDVWPAPMSIVIVTDLSGSMYDADIQCDSDTDLDTRIGCAKLSLRGDESQGIEGLLDRLARAREDSGDVRVALATFGEVAANTPAGFRDVKVDAQRQELKNAVQGYSANQGYTRTNLGLQQAVDLLNGDPSARTKVIIFLTDGQTTGLPSGQTFATAVRPIADAFKAGGTDRYIFTIAFSANPSQTVRDQMQQVASTPTDQFYFFGGDLAAFYEQIVGVIAGVSITILPTSGSSPSAVTYASRTQSGVRVAAGDEFAQTCAANGQPTTYRIRIDFRARSGSDPSSRYVWLRNPSALICTGPPWASGTGAGGGSGGGGASGGVGAPGTVESWTGSATCAATCASAGFPGCADVQFNTECPNGTLLQAWQDDNPDFDDLSSIGRDCSSSVEYRSVLTGPSRCFGQSGTDYQRFRCRCQ